MLTTYHFKDVIFFSSKHQMVVKDDQQLEVGTIIRAYNQDIMRYHQQIRKGTFYAFMDREGHLQMSVAVIKRGMKSIQGYEYELYNNTDGELYVLKDVRWLIYLYFHIKGDIYGHKFEANEDWDGKCVLKVDKKKYAEISFDELTFKVTIGIMDKVEPIFMSPAFLTQIYCLFRIYSMESKAVEEIIGQMT